MKQNHIFSALELKMPDMLAWAIAEGNDVNEQREDGATPLLLAVSWKQAWSVRMLLENGADPDLGENGFSPLMIAAQENAVEIASILAEKANVNFKGKYGLTSLMVAARDGNNEIVRILLEKGADPSIQTDQGSTALDMARHFNQVETATLLEVKLPPGLSSYFSVYHIKTP